MICPESHSSSMCAYLAVSDSFATLWTVAHQVPLSMGFLRQESWSWWLFSFPRDLPDPGIKPVSLMSPALAGGFFTTRATWETYRMYRSRDQEIS